MGIFKRALLSIVRQPVKSLILLATVVILCTLIAGAVSIKQGLLAMQKIIGSQINLTAVMQQRIADNKVTTPEDLLQVPPFTDQKIDQIAALPQVKGYEVMQYMAMSSSRLVFKDYAGTGYALGLGLISAKDGHLLDYEMGNLSITSGRWLTPEDEDSPFNPVVISDDLAGGNRLTVGSKIALDSVNDSDSPLNQESTFTVIGIYTSAKQYQIRNGLMVAGNDTSSIYTAKTTLDGILASAMQRVKEKGGDSRSMFYSAPTFTLWLKDRQSVDAFSDAVNAVGVPKDYRVVLSTAEYDRTLSPLKNLDFIVNLIIAASVLATVSILGFVIALVLRGRRNEIGIFFSLGERKKCIAQQVVTEVLMIAVIGITASVLIGTNLSGWVSNQMLQKEVSTFVQAGGNSSSTVDVGALHTMTQGVEVTLGGDTIALIYLVGMLTAGISSILPVVFTLRLNPKNILMEGE